MAMDDHVDFVFAEHTQITGGAHRHRRAKEDIADVGGHHGAAPAIRQRVAQGVAQDVLGFHVHTGVGAVHGLDDLDIDATGHYAILAP